MLSNKVAVLVAGSWGTALASVLADNGKEVWLWSRNEDQVTEINTLHLNSRFLAYIKLSSDFMATSSVQDALSCAEAVILVVPS
jgi:glycerol-3-phosphate dehydrogenase (NAD(P)+)